MHSNLLINLVLVLDAIFLLNFAGHIRIVGDTLEALGINLREECVTLEMRLDVCEINAMAERRFHCLLVHGRSANNPNVLNAL